MALPAYSYRLCALEMTSVGFSDPYFPPEGYKWLVTAVTIHTPPNSAYVSSIVYDGETGIAIAGASYPTGVIDNWLMEKTDHVVEESSSILFYCAQVDTTFFVSGKQLSVDGSL